MSSLDVKAFLRTASSGASSKGDKDQQQKMVLTGEVDLCEGCVI